MTAGYITFAEDPLGHLRHLLLPALTLGIGSGTLLGGTIIVENVFSWPGISTLMIQGIDRRDLSDSSGRVPDHRGPLSAHQPDDRPGQPPSP
jgi:ABC-type dipeptide/oligopeptide/nickel transport system permease component